MVSKGVYDSGGKGVGWNWCWGDSPQQSELCRGAIGTHQTDAPPHQMGDPGCKKRSAIPLYYLVDRENQLLCKLYA